MRSLRLLCVALILPAAAVMSADPPSPVSGKAVVPGKTLTLRHAWLVRAPDKFDQTRLSSYIVLSADDISADIRKCPDRKCVLYDALKNGMAVESREGGFWAFVAHPDLPVDTQFSGPSAGEQGWTIAARTAYRLAGRLRYRDEDRKTACDLTMDALFLKEFPAQPASAAAAGR